MKFTEKEMATINAAKRKAKHSTIIRVMIIIAMLIGLVGMFTGALVIDHFAYLLVGLVVLGIAHPQFGSPPKYEDLVRLLEEKSSSSNANT